MMTVMFVAVCVVALVLFLLVRGWQSRAIRAVQALDGLLTSATSWPIGGRECDCCGVLSISETHAEGCAYEESVELLREPWAVEAAGD